VSASLRRRFLLCNQPIESDQENSAVIRALIEGMVKNVAFCLSIAGTRRKKIALFDKRHSA